MPQYKYIKGKELIARAIDSFTIDNTQWVYSAPLWIADALAQLKIIQTYQYTNTVASVVGHRCELPCNLQLLIAVEYKGYRLRRLGKINTKSSSVLSELGYMPNEGYEVVGDNWITTTFDEGDIVFHYKALAVDYDTTKNIMIPKVPDDPYVIEAVKWYLIQQLLFKGFKHPVFDLNSNNEFTNPGLQWEKNKKRARNSVNIIDADTRREMSILSRTFIYNYNFHSEQILGSSNSLQGSSYNPPTIINSVANGVVTNDNTELINNVNEVAKYSQIITNMNTFFIPASTHKLGTNVICTFYILEGPVYTQADASFEIDVAGNVTWYSEQTVSGLIILI